METVPLLTLVTRLLCAGIVLQSIELLAHARELRNDGMLGWNDLPGRLFGLHGNLRWLHTHPTCLVILIFRALAAAACLLSSFESAATPWLVAGLVGAQAYYNHRLKMIHEGSDSMFLVGLTAVFAAAVEPTEPRLRAAALVFFAFQVLLAYFAAGWDKLRAPAWRNGSLLTRALRHGAHRFEPLGDILERSPTLARGLSWQVILIELLFPLCVLLPMPGFWAFAALGILFHATVAFCMGLHGFFWSFVAAYPAVYFVAHSVAAVLYARSGG